MPKNDTVSLHIKIDSDLDSFLGKVKKGLGGIESSGIDISPLQNDIKELYALIHNIETEFKKI